MTLTPPPLPKFVKGRCSSGNPVCGRPARLYASGWRCEDHIAKTGVKKIDEPTL